MAKLKLNVELEVRLVYKDSAGKYKGKLFRYLPTRCAEPFSFSGQFYLATFLCGRKRKFRL